MDTVDVTISLRIQRRTPYYTALVWTARFYTQPIMTIGISRNYLSGGLIKDRPFTSWDAALLPFEELFIDTKIKNYPSDWEPHDRWDETMAGFVSLHFPNSGLQLFIELGTDDHRQNWMDLRSQPDHNTASIIGLRKYGLFNNRFLLGGFEYANIKKSYTYKNRGGGHWWKNDFYDFWMLSTKHLLVGFPKLLFLCHLSFGIPNTVL